MNSSTSKANRDIGTASPKKGGRRLYNKLLQFVACKVPFLPSGARSLLQSLRGVKFVDRKSVFLGEDVYFDDICPELVTVGKNVRITAGSRILTHFFDTGFVPSTDRPFRFYFGNVHIEDNVFIGMNTVIANPLRIGCGAAIGANSLVTRDVPDNAIALGVPAIVVASRPALQH